MEAVAGDAEHLRAVESLLAFWADAGVDSVFGDAPVDRAPPQGRAPSPSPTAATAPSSDPPPRASRPETATTAAAHALASAADDLEALAVAANAAGGRGAVGYVFYRGDADPEVVVIVDAPDDDDRSEGRPAAGAKGRLLDRMLGAAGLSGRVLIVNAALRSGDDARARDAPGAFAPFVERALVLARPRAVLAAGAAAARLFFPSVQSIPRLRGSWAQWRQPDRGVSTPVLATFSPTLLLEQPAAKKLAWRDIMTLGERLEAQGDADLP